MSSITLADVARRAGVSVKTVSRVINNEARVAEETRQRVMAVVDELSYVPNVWAQRLARGHSGLVGLVMFDATPAYLMSVIRGLMDIGDPAGYRVGLYRLNIQDPRQIAQFVGMAMQRRVEGLVFTPPCDNSPELISELRNMGFPFVQLTPHERCNGCAWVAATDRQGVHEATWHLLRLGHQRIGFIHGSPNHMASLERLEGYRQALREAGQELDESIVLPGDWTFQTGLDRARELLALSPRPTAIIAGNDDMAAGVLQAAWERGLKCPEDISVVGFDDVQLARQLSPPLTTVKQPIYDIAATAMSMLVNKMIPGEPVEQGIEVPTELVIRYSTARSPISS